MQFSDYVPCVDQTMQLPDYETSFIFFISLIFLFRRGTWEVWRWKYQNISSQIHKHVLCVIRNETENCHEIGLSATHGDQKLGLFSPEKRNLAKIWPEFRNLSNIDKMSRIFDKNVAFQRNFLLDGMTEFGKKLDKIVPLLYIQHSGNLKWNLKCHYNEMFYLDLLLLLSYLNTDNETTVDNIVPDCNQL